MKLKIKYSYSAFLLILTMIFGLGFLSGLAFSAPEPKGKTVSTKKDLAIDELLNLSGVDSKIASAESFYVNINQLNKTDLPFGQTAFIQSIFDQVYRAKDFRDSVVEQLQRKYNAKYAREALEWYRTPVAQNIIQIQLNSYRPYDHSRVSRFIKFYDDDEEKKRRLQILQEMAEASGQAEYEIGLLKVFAGMLFPFEEDYKGKPVSKWVAGLSDELKVSMQKQIVENGFYTYRDLSTDELMQYKNFLQSNAGKWFHDSVHWGSENGMTLVGVTAKNFQRRIYAEVEKKGADHLLLKQIAPPGHRYRLIRRRDPFKPLIIDGVLQVARAKPKKKVKVNSQPRTKSKGKVKDFRGYGREFKESPKIPLEVYKRLKKDDPDLYADLNFYATLFQDKSKLKSMSRSEYRGAVSKYKAILTRASEKKLYPTPLQIGYKSIKLMGVIWKNQEMVALVEIEGSMGQTVKKGVLIGPNYGVVESIKRDEIIIVERSRDYLGNILTRKKSIEFFNKPEEG
jgi:hypothetical protein